MIARLILYHLGYLLKIVTKGHPTVIIYPLICFLRCAASFTNDLFWVYYRSKTTKFITTDSSLKITALVIARKTSQLMNIALALRPEIVNSSCWFVTHFERRKNIEIFLI